MTGLTGSSYLAPNPASVIQIPLVRSLYLIAGLIVLLAVNVRGDTYKLSTGETLNGEVLATTANDQGVQIKVGEGEYQKVPWASFAQEDLKTFARNQRMQPFVEPFIEPDPTAKIKKTEVNIKQPPRFERPAKQSLVGAMFSSSVGIFVLLVLYGANIYAGYEVSIFRAQPPMLVCGLSAIPVLGFAAPIVFLSMATKMEPSAPAVETVPAEEALEGAAAADDDVNPMHADGAQHPASLKLADAQPEKGKSNLPETVKFQRGQFTFNRRFFETKFPGFFGVVKREADKDMVLVIKSARGEYIGERISRIAANDLHLQVHKGHATEEVMIPFQDIQEIRLQHRGV